MAFEPTGVSEEVIGSLKSCFVEGDPAQQRRERKIRRRALFISIVLQTVVVAAVVVFPLLGRSERITYNRVVLPPYARAGPVKHHAGKTNPSNGGRKICVVCVDLRNPLRALKPGEPIPTTLNEPEGDSIPGLPAGPGVPGSLNLEPSSTAPSRPGNEVEVVRPKRLKASLEPAMLTHRVDPV